MPPLVHILPFPAHAGLNLVASGALRFSSPVDKANLSYFVARVALIDTKPLGVHQMKLVPGMPAEIYIRTGDREALSYMMKPLTDQVAKALIER